MGKLFMMHIKSNEPGKAYELVGHVVHCTPLPHGEWSVGCEFVNPLSRKTSTSAVRPQIHHRLAASLWRARAQCRPPEARG